MKIAMRRVVSFCLLCLFIFPTLTQFIHTCNHANEIQCTDRSAEHLHTKEAHCKICDFQGSPVWIPYAESRVSFAFFQCCRLQTGKCNNTPTVSIITLSLRGPPVA